MRMRLLVVTVAAALMLLHASPSHAIIDGVPDRGEHPYVGQLIFYVPDAVDPRFDDPGAWFNCSGSLLDATIVVTAGHCTFATGREGESTTAGGGTGSGGTDVWVSFAEAPDYSILPPSTTFAPGDNQGRYDAWSAALDRSAQWREATAYPHPDYVDATFFLHDAGVLRLAAPRTTPEYGELPTLGLLDTYAKNRRQRFTAVGYGLVDSGPKTAVGGDTRQRADMRLIGLKGVFGIPVGTAAKFAGSGPDLGSTCFGDSGGPILVAGTNTITSVTSFGLNLNCSGPGGGYRLDQPDDLAWLATFGVTP